MVMAIQHIEQLKDAIRQEITAIPHEMTRQLSWTSSTVCSQ